MYKKILLIHNPVSGTIYNKVKYNAVIKNLKKKYKINIRNTTNTVGADEILRKEQEDYDYIFLCGGDGTLNQAITSLSNNEEKKKPIIYIPFGTTNDFGKSLKLYRSKLTKEIGNYKIKKFDTGIINNKEYFNYIVATGVFTKSSYTTKKKLKKFLEDLHILQMA